jgi:hypothetical protein
MFGLPPIAALAISTNVERAVDRRLRGPDPLAAGLARLEALCDRLQQQPSAASDVARVEEILAHACARIEEWS